MSARDDKARTERLAAALRENLKRRKAQARGRAGTTQKDEPARTRDRDDQEASTGRKPPGEV